MTTSRKLRIGLMAVLAIMLLALVASDSEYYTHETIPGDYLKKMNVNGRRREFILHMPSAYDGKRRLPVVIVLHGSSAGASVVERETSFDRVADSLGFIAVYPQGLHRGWNIGECCRYSFMKHISDIDFIGSLLDHLEAGVSIDTSRVFVTGYSDGATLSLLLACSLSQRITAVAAVAGTLFDPLPSCNLARPIPVMIIHATGDTHIPYDGQRGAQATTRVQHLMLSAPEVTEFWVDHDNCTTSPHVVRTGRVVRTEYNCSGSAQVLFYTIEGGEHGWPGGSRGWIFSPLPPVDMNATDSIASFFMRQKIARPVMR